MTRKQLALTILFFISGAYLLMVYYLITQDKVNYKEPEVTLSAPVSMQPLSPSVPSVSAPVPALVTNPGWFTGTPEVATPTVTSSFRSTTGASSEPMFTTSSQTVHTFGGGGNGGVGASGSSTGANQRGIQLTSAASLAMTTLPLAVRNLKEGMTAEEGLHAGTPRRTIIHDGGGEDNYGDDNLRPNTNPTDPFFTPIGSMPWLWMLLLAALYMLAIRRSRT